MDDLPVNRMLIHHRLDVIVSVHIERCVKDVHLVFFKSLLEYIPLIIFFYNRRAQYVFDVLVISLHNLVASAPLWNLEYLSIEASALFDTTGK